MFHRDPASRIPRLLLFVILSAALPATWAQEGELAPMGSEAELTEFLQGLQEAEQAEMSQYPQDGSELAEIVTTGSRAAPESITNSQHAGVDEGGIVKQHGDHLVILRRGRLFTVDISGPRLKPVAAINAFGPGLDGDGTWYDEMLVSESSVVVIGYSYSRGGTEIGIFNINANGGLRHRATYHLRSFDYYSSRNYASRLIDGKLILYAPLSLSGFSSDPLDVLPAMRKWTGEESEDEGEFKRIITARDIYRPPVSSESSRARVLHSMTVCDLARRELQCKAMGVIGDWGRVFYVSPKAMYVWVDDPGHDGSATLVRMPLKGRSPGAIRVLGGPIDQFSFDETPDGTLNVLVESVFAGDAMWSAEHDGGENVALLSIPVRSFGDGSSSAPEAAYRPLPRPSEDGTIHNRFVGKYLLYGTGEGWWEEDAVGSKVIAVPLEGGAVREFALPHGVDRIEPLGRHALVVGEGGDDDLHFTALHLSRKPALAQRYVMKNAAQGELRSHGFFYKADGRGGGVLGLPVNNPASPGYEHLFDESASVAFLRKTSQTFEDLGQLSANDAGAVDDACESSCVDWYGNSRPLFIEDRIFALLGYELVEGRKRGKSIREVRRVNFAPRLVTAAR